MKIERNSRKNRHLACLAGLLLVVGASVNAQDTTPESFQHVARFKGVDYTIEYEKLSMYTEDCEFLENSGTNAGVVTLYEAEDGTLDGGVVASNTVGFTGTGYVTLDTDGTIEWEVVIPTAGLYFMTVNHQGDEKDVKDENGVKGEITLDMPLVKKARPILDTDGEWSWNIRESQPYMWGKWLDAGTNTIKVSQSSSSAILVDCLRIEHPGDAVNPDAFKTFDPGPTRTYLGTVQGLPEACAIGYLRKNDTVHGFVFMDRSMTTRFRFDTHFSAATGDPDDMVHPESGYAERFVGELSDHFWSAEKTEVPRTSDDVPGVTHTMNLGVDVIHSLYLDAAKGDMDEALDIIDFSLLKIYLQTTRALRIQPLYDRVVVRKTVNGSIHKYGEVGTSLYSVGANQITDIGWNTTWGGDVNDSFAAIYGIATVHVAGWTRFSDTFTRNPYHPYAHYNNGHEFGHVMDAQHQVSSFCGGGIMGGFYNASYVSANEVGYCYNNRITEWLTNEWVNTVVETDMEKFNAVNVHPYATDDFRIFDGSQGYELVVDVLDNDFDCNGDDLHLVGFDQTTSRGRRVVRRIDATTGRPVLCVIMDYDHAGFDQFDYLIEDENGAQSRAKVVIDARKPTIQIEAEDLLLVTSANNPTDALIGIRNYHPNMRCIELKGKANRQDWIEFTAVMPEEGQYTLRFKVGEGERQGAYKNHNLELLVGTNLISSTMPFRGAMVRPYYDFAVYHQVSLDAGTNTIRLQEPEGMAGHAIKVDYLRINSGIDYQINFNEVSQTRVTHNVVLDTGAEIKDDDDFHPENGLSYGWTLGTTESVGDKTKVRPADLAYETSQCWPDGCEDTWEIELPNGLYEVHCVAGGMKGETEVNAILGYRGTDADGERYFYPGTGIMPYHNDFLIEGVRFNGSDSKKNVYDLMQHRVKVTDGRLTVARGPTADEPRLAKLIITSVDESLVSHYRFEDNADDLLELNNGVLNSAPTYVDGILGQAINLDGVDDYVVCGTDPGSDGDLSFAVWMKADAVELSRIASKVDNNTATPGWELLANGAGSISLLLEGNGTSRGGNRIMATDAYLADTWVHVVCTFDGSTGDGQIYINGALAAAENFAGCSVEQQDIALLLGARSDTQTSQFNGTLDDVRIYNYVIDAGQVGNLYNMGIVPSAVANLGSTNDLTSVTLDWDDHTATDLGYYVVYRGTSPRELTEYATGLTVSEFVDSNVEDGTTYYYEIRIVDSYGNVSADNVETSEAIPANKPPVVINKTLDPINQGKPSLKNLRQLTTDETPDAELRFSVVGTTSALGNPIKMQDNEYRAKLTGTFPGSDSYQYIAKDLQGLSSTGTLSVVINGAPIVENVPPVADAGSDITGSDNNHSGFKSIKLDGSGSSDLGGALDYVWRVDGAQVATGVSPRYSAPVGSTTVELTVTDADGDANSDTVVVNIFSIDVNDSIVTLWHELETVPTVNDDMSGEVWDFSDFAGIDLESLDEVDLLNSTNKSWSVWFKATDVTTRQIIYEQGFKKRGANIYLNDGDVVMSIWGMRGTSWSASFSKAVFADVWNHAVLVLDGSTVHAYLNEEWIDSKPGGVLPRQPAQIGIGYVNEQTRMDPKIFGSDGSHQFSGRMDDLRIYDRSLTEGEVFRIYNAPVQ